MKTFRDWLATHESSPAIRLRWDAALGLKPPIPDASIHSHSTARPWEVEKLVGKGRKKKKKKKVNESTSLLSTWLNLCFD